MSKYWSPSSAGTTAPSAAPTVTPTPRISKPQPSYQQEEKGFFERTREKILGSERFQKAVASPFGSKVMEGLGWLGEKMATPLGQAAGRALMAPSRYTSGVVMDREQRQRESGTRNEPKSFSGFLSAAFDPLKPSGIKAGLKNVFKPSKELDPWGGGFLGEGSVVDKRREAGEKITPLSKDIAFALEVLYPTVAEFGIGKAVSAIPGAAKLGQQFMKPISKATGATGDYIKKSKLGSVIEALEPGFKAPGAKKLLDEAVDMANFRVNQLQKIIKKAADGMTPEQQRIVGELMENGAKVVAKADEPLRVIAKQMTDLGDKVGREGVELFEKTKGKFGLSPESFAKYEGKYLTHIWDQMIKGGDTAYITTPSGAPKLLQRFMKERKGKEGYIKEFSPAVYKGLGTEITENEIARGYIAIAEKFGLKADEAQKLLVKNGPDALRDFGYVPADVINLKTAGIFKDTLLPKDVVDFIKGSAARAGTTAWDKAWNFHDKALNLWKLGKTIYNPAYHVRNIISNQILANMATGGSLARTVIDSFQGLFNYLGHGSQKYVGAAENVSLIRKAGLIDNYKILMGNADLVQKGNIRKFLDLWKTFQNHSEDVAKLSVFKRSIDDIVKVGNRSLDEVLADPAVLKVAKDLAEKAIFSPYKIGSGERVLMSRIIPFYSFSRQAIPFTVKTAIKHPERLAKYPRFKQAVEAYGGDTVPEEDRPEWQKDSIQLPWKSKDGDRIVLDTQYLYPWGNLGESPVDSLSRGQLPFGLSLNPFAMEVAQQQAKKDFYFDKEFGDSKLPGFSFKDMTSIKPRRAGSQKWAHAANTILPALYRTYFGKIKPAFKGEKDYAGRTRDVKMALFDAFGLKTTALRPEEKKRFDFINKILEIEEIESQMYSIMRDQRFTDEEERKQFLREYVEEMKKASKQ